MKDPHHTTHLGPTWPDIPGDKEFISVSLDPLEAAKPRITLIRWLNGDFDIVSMTPQQMAMLVDWWHTYGYTTLG